MKAVTKAPSRWRKIETLLWVSILPILPLLPFVGPISPRAQVETVRSLQGIVVFADGTAVKGAKVEMFAFCDETSLTQNTTTGKDGSFSFPGFIRPASVSSHSFDNCRDFRFRASKIEDYWILSDENVFSGSSAPSTTSTPGLPSEPIRIVLRTRGGRVGFRVWDVATGRFIRADLDLERQPVKGKRFGSMLLATGLDGAADFELLPAGGYTVQVESYPCQSSEYRTNHGPILSFTIEPATQIEETIRIDVRNIKPLPRYDGHRLKNCKS